jgi:hypothetical protein
VYYLRVQGAEEQAAPMINMAAEEPPAPIINVTAEKPPRAVIQARMQQIQHRQPWVIIKHTTPGPTQLQGPLGDITNTVGVTIVKLRPPPALLKPKTKQKYFDIRAFFPPAAQPHTG